MTKKRWMVLIISVAVILLGLIGGTVWLIAKTTQEANESEKTAKETPQYTSTQQLTADVNQKNNSGDYQGAITLIEGQKNVGDPANQVLLAQAYANAGNYAKALEIYKKLDSAGQLPDIELSNAAAAAEQAGDIKTAIAYYKRAENYARNSKDQNIDQADVYAGKVAELEKK